MILNEITLIIMLIIMHCGGFPVKENNGQGGGKKHQIPQHKA